jgi:hypothetical protein
MATDSPAIHTPTGTDRLPSWSLRHFRSGKGTIISAVANEARSAAISAVTSAILWWLSRR